MITIYVVCHKTFENANVFFVNKRNAVQYIENDVSIKYPDENKQDWSIIEIKEGVEFNGDLLY